MPRLWLAALGAAAVIACGDDTSGGGPNDLFPDVAGTYAIQGGFDGVPASLESSLLDGTASITLIDDTGNLVISNADLQDASVTLAGVVEFTVESPASNATWTFTGERAGDVWQRCGVRGEHDGVPAVFRQYHAGGELDGDEHGRRDAGG